jgi:hypothetical protein
MTEIKDLKNALGKYLEGKRELDAFLSLNGKSSIISAFQDALKDCPNIGVHWTQYVPGFNDGEPCMFSPGEFSIFPLNNSVLVDETDEDDISDAPEESSIYEQDGKLFTNSGDREINQAHITLEQYQALDEVWYKLDNYILETVFGSNAEITITSDSVTIDDDYSCGY